jgi:hypothetical protein
MFCWVIVSRQLHLYLLLIRRLMMMIMMNILQVKRMINADLSLTNTSCTAALNLHSVNSTIKAKASYRNLQDDKTVEATLDVNGHKQFDTLMSLKRHDIKHGYVWVPTAHWIVDNATIAELTGK